MDVNEIINIETNNTIEKENEIKVRKMLQDAYEIANNLDIENYESN